MNDKRRALVTGGSSGIGQATAFILSMNNWDVFAPPSYQLNVREREDWIRHLDAVKPELIVNCVAICKPSAIYDTTTFAEVLRHCNTNLYPAIYTYDLADRRNTVVINIGSTAAVKPIAGKVGYNVTKAALVALTETKYLEQWKTACVSPGRTDTPLGRKLADPDDTLLSPVDVAHKVLSVYESIMAGDWSPHYLIEKKQ